jgi:hypothetical protein
VDVRENGAGILFFNHSNQPSQNRHSFIRPPGLHPIKTERHPIEECQLLPGRSTRRIKPVVGVGVKQAVRKA